MEPAVIDANVVNGFGNAESEKMVSPGHEPGDDDGTADEPEEVVGGAEDDELEGAHGSGRDGRADDPGPARRERRRGGRPCTSPVYGAVRPASSEASYGCSRSRTDVGCGMRATTARHPDESVRGHRGPVSISSLKVVFAADRPLVVARRRRGISYPANTPPAPRSGIPSAGRALTDAVAPSSR